MSGSQTECEECKGDGCDACVQPARNPTPGQWVVDEEPDTSGSYTHRLHLTIRARGTDIWKRSNQMGDYRGCIVADLAPAHGHRPHAYQEARANAALLAAAPDMLEALDTSALVIHAPHSNTFAECPDSVCRSNRAALAKARGES